MKLVHNVKHATLHLSFTAAAMAALAGPLMISGTVNAAAATKAKTSAGATLTATQQQHLQTIISKGDQEIARRLATLNTLTSKINAATKLSAGDKATLSSEVTSSTSGLTALKSQLDAETTLAAARTDAQSIYSEYRVYALVAPKVGLVKVADDQQAVEGKLTALAQQLQTRITAEQQAGKDVTTLQSQLSDMTTQTNAAQAISSSIESGVIGLQPTDYNSNHAVLTGDNTKLKTAHADNQAADTDAKNIVSALKSM
jgi:hypothetical protein